MNDWSDHVKDAPEIGHNSSGVIGSHIRSLLEARRNVARIEDELKQAKALERQISEQTIPDAFEFLGLDPNSSLVVDGFKVTLKTVSTVQPKAANREKLWDWLQENGHAALVKRKVVFSLGRDSDAQAAELLEAHPELGGEFERTVHPATLKSWVLSTLKDGEEIPLDLVGLRQVRQAEVKSVD